MPAENRSFDSLDISEWRQFGHVFLQFHPRLTVITGANATGKSTILGILAKHFDWQKAYISAPMGMGKSSPWSALGTWARYIRFRSPKRPETVIGYLTYSDAHQTTIEVPAGEYDRAQQYNLTYGNLAPVNGVNLISHRSAGGNYGAVESIPTRFGSAETAYNQYVNEVRTRWLGSWTGRTPQASLKEALIASAVFGEGSRSVDRNPGALEIWEGYQEVLRSVLPASIGFQGLRVRSSEIVVLSGSGEFILDEASGGISAIMEISWQLFLYSRVHQSFTVLIDEPENHLHPSLQRDLLPSLLSAFPHAQFIVATHSPFVVTAVPDSRVYVLDHSRENADQYIRSTLLDHTNKASNADEVLRNVLGMESTFPRWAERSFMSIVEPYLGRNLSSADFETLRSELAARGLVGQFPDAFVAIAERISRRESK